MRHDFIIKYRYALRIAVIVLSVLMFVSACNAMGCQYEDVPGSAVVTKIEPGDAKVVVTLDFQAADPQKQISARHRMPNTFSEEMTQAQFNARRPAVGQKFQAVRSDITSGTCTPGVFKVNW